MAYKFTSFTSVSEASRAIQDFLYDRDAALPDDVRERLRDLVSPTSSPVDAVVQGAELLYARKDELAEEALALGAGLALVGQQFAFNGMAVDNRGSRMALAFMRDAGIKAPPMVEYPDPETDPASVVDMRASTPMPTIIPDEEIAVTNVIVDEAPTPPEETPPAAGARRGRGRRTNSKTVNTR